MYNFRNLDQKTREILALKYFEEFSNREIARQTGINESTVSTNWLRRLEKLRKVWRRSTRNLMGSRAR